MKMKMPGGRKLRHACYVTAVSALMFGVAIARSHPPSASVGARPSFTLYYTERSLVPTTGRSTERAMYYAERADGALSYGLYGPTPRRREIVNPFQKWQVTVSDLEKLKTTYDRSYIQGTPRRRELPAACNSGGSNLLGIDVILGYRAYHYQRPLRLGDGTSFDEHSWFVEELACLGIQQTVNRLSPSGQLTGVFEKKPITLSVGEPVPSLFAIPEDYREVRPSEYEETLLRGTIAALQGPDAAKRHVIPPHVSAYFAEMDENYAKVQAQAQHK
jgi:hypothetical protein